ncbi:MAG: hypothetical protein IRZ08_20650 [Frankia sp.]|nr:hypothetical protein [Frankia sp.]
MASIVGLGAVRLIGDGITGAGSDPLTEAEVSALLAASRQSTGTSGAPATGPAASPTTAGPTGTAQPVTPGPTATATVEGRGQILRTPGGVLTAECVQGDRAYLLYWSPAAGYATAPDVRRGPNRHAELRFVGPVDAVEVRVSCENGQPAVEWETDDDGGDDG